MHLTGARQPAPAGSARTASSGPVQANFVLRFDDNRKFAELLGQYDSHLLLIEQRLKVSARATGNMIAISGPEDACQMAKEVLEHLHSRIERGDRIVAGDVEGAIRHALRGPLRPQPRPNLSEPVAVAAGMAQIKTRKRLIAARTPNQSAYIRALETRDVVFGVGPAGTGKTYLAVVFGAAMLERGEVDRIILSRPAVEAGERLGFLPGDMREKVDPYLRPLYDALYDVLPAEKVEKGLEAGMIEIAPLAFMRGRTLAHSFIILDEAQNSTPTQMKMFLTRLGEGAKMAITGDPSQVDLPKGQVSGLADALSRLEGVPDIGRVHFGSADVVRRDIVARIVEAYEKSGWRGG
jgi:phosphate starvation-inducible PhoH-like protein